MASWPTTVKHLLDKALAPLGVELVRSSRRITDLHLYPDSSRPTQPRYINVGAGDFYHPMWHNLDVPNEYYAGRQRGRLHIDYDLSAHLPMPMDDDSVAVAYTSHVVEHVSDADVEFMFAEVYRCLHPGGYFRVTCPDIDLEYAAFRRSDAAFWKWPNAYGIYNDSVEQKFLDHFATALTVTHPDTQVEKCSDAEVRELFASLPMEQALDTLVARIPPHARQRYHGDHVNWFNRAKLSRMLRRAGFGEVYPSAYGQSHCPLLRSLPLFDSTCPELSLYVECRK